MLFVAPHLTSVQALLNNSVTLKQAPSENWRGFVVLQSIFVVVYVMLNEVRQEQGDGI